MKLFVLSVVMIFGALSSFAQNQSPKLPGGLCSNPSQPCSPRQLEILKQFETSSTAPALPATHSLYQGGCYMLSSIYSADHEHFGFIYVRSQENSKWDFNGQFGFFYQQNPYKQMTPADAAVKFPEISKNTVQARTDDWLVEIDTKNNWRYFARQTEEGKIALIGLWGIYDAILCEMTENK